MLLLMPDLQYPGFASIDPAHRFFARSLRMVSKLKRSRCPVCETEHPSGAGSAGTVAGQAAHPYLSCPRCALLYQSTFVPNDGDGFNHAMSQYERDVNQALAHTLQGWFAASEVPRSALDIGANYPWLTHSLGQLGWHCHALDKLPEIVPVTAQQGLHTRAWQLDFDLACGAGAPWPWDSADHEQARGQAHTQPRGQPQVQQFDLVLLVNVLNQLQYPLQALQAIFKLTKPGGLVFIRCPDSEAESAAQHFSPEAVQSNPQLWCERALAVAAELSGFTVQQTYPLFNLRDTVLRKPGPSDPVAVLGQPDAFNQKLAEQRVKQPHAAKLALGVGMIVKNEQDDLPGCLDSVRDLADLICIVDTGSTDATMDVIRAWADANRWQARFDDTPPAQIAPRTVLVRSYTGASEPDEKGDWKLWNFSQARNQFVGTLNFLCDWVLWMDADDVLLAPQQVKPLLTQPYDVFGFGIVDAAENHTTRFVHHRLWRSGMGIEFQGACHEYPNWPRIARVLDTPYNIQHRWTVSVHQEAGPSRNLRILEREYQHGVRTPRVLFYLGNTLKDAGQYGKAIDIYQEYLRQPVGYWDEMIFCALYKMRCERQLAFHSGNYSAFFATLFETMGKDQRFSEIAMEGAYAYYDLGLWRKSIALCHYALQNPPDSQLFIEFDKYYEQPQRFLAFGYQRLEEWQSAVYHARLYLARVPGDAGVQALLDECLARLQG
jgi:SAM-dependent methyltransferase/tetratricopeptide (TPR) repeat protein